MNEPINAFEEGTRPDQRKKDFTALLSRLDQSKSTAEKFRDFCELAYCAHAKLTASPERGEELEERYMQIVGTYENKDDIRAMPELLALVWDAMLDGGDDFLGDLSAQLNVLDAKAGQFFTPYHVSQLMAQISLNDAKAHVDERGFITVCEPCAGAGGMVLAAADTLSSQGFNPSLQMLVHATDISEVCYHMCYLQLTFRGISAYIVRGNTLSLETFESAWTPAALTFYGKHGCLFPEGESQPKSPEPIFRDGQQFNLFE